MERLSGLFGFFLRHCFCSLHRKSIRWKTVAWASHFSSSALVVLKGEWRCLRRLVSAGA
jgi:hypothetical protein